ncbi:hypothetical protein JB92DRAFT_2837708 [Gautieria morchelliformis]|nr:hypothetical protein JB92DRAFT_2837708 [Gautieria morchelliformis]
MSPYFQVCLCLQVLFLSVLMSCPLLNIPMVQLRIISPSYGFLSDFKVVLQKSRYFWTCPHFGTRIFTCAVLLAYLVLTVVKAAAKSMVSFPTSYYKDKRNSCGVRPATHSTDDDVQDPFSFATWPVTDAARDAMNTVKHTHDISPLPTFDVNSDDIVPSQYDRLLKGAVVEVHFAPTSWVFAGRSAKAMSIPVIREMLVISPPKPPVASPMKRKNIRDGPSMSPKKKIHA